MADKKMYKVGITVKEPWSADISYEVLDVTLYAVENGGDGCSYIAIRANQGVTPGTDDTVWVKATQRGQSIYDLAVKYGDFEGTEAEFEAEYEAALHAAQSAAQSASDIEARVETNEAARVTAERARSDAETARSSAETARINAENARNDAESLRDTAESDRVRAEAGRVTAEASRVEAETFRQGAEQSRRQQFEGLKTDMETAIDNVDAKSAEIAEDIEGYEANEAARVTAEQSRVSAESSRVSAESARVTAENARVAQASSDHTRAESDHTRAEEAAAAAEHMVDIKQGPQGPQGNTGSSVDYPYELVNNLTTDDATKGLSAAQGVVLDGKVSQLGQNKNYIPDAWTSTSGIVTDHVGYIVTDKIPGLQGEKVYLANLGNTTRYALAYDSQGNVIGYRSNAYPSYTLPEGTAFFVVCFGPNATDYHVYKNNMVVWTKTDGPNTFINLKAITDSVNQEIVSVSQKTDDAYDALYFWELMPKLIEYNYQLVASGKLGTTANYKHRLLNVEEGDVIRLTSTYHTRELCYAFLTTASINHTSGEVLPIVDGTKVTCYSNSGNNGEPILGDVEITIPSGCKALIFDFYSTAYNKYYIRRNKTDEVVSCYNDYIKSRAFDVRKKDINLGQNADSLIFFTDYHIYNGEANIITNYGHSPALIKYLTEHTNTEKVVFGGDVFTSPDNDTDRYRLMDEFLTLFNFAPKMFTAVGNHEWRQSNNDGRVKDFGSHAKKLEGLVTFGRDSSGKITQPYYYFDNPALRLRYFVLYTPGPVPSSSYAVYNYPEQIAFLESKVGELTSDWRVIIIQHIMYETSTTPGAQESNDYYATKLSKAQCGTDLTGTIVENNANTSRAKIICVLSGHMHTDFCEFIDPSCVSICVCCDATYGKRGVAPNGLRICGTITEQSFDVYHFDLSDNVIYSTKIGFGSNRVVNLGEVGVNVGGTITLTSSLASVDLWQSQDESVATVANGVVTGVSAGRVTILARKEGDENAEMEYFNIIVS